VRALKRYALSIEGYALSIEGYALSTGESDKFHAHVVYNDMQKVCGSNRLVMVPVQSFAGESLGINFSVDFLPDAKHLSVADKPTFVDVLGEATWSHT